MRIWKFYIQAENGFLACVYSCEATSIIQAFWNFEKIHRLTQITNIVKIESL